MDFVRQSSLCVENQDDRFGRQDHKAADRKKTADFSQWDTAGQERFRTLTSSYYRGAHGIIIVYDVTDRDTFENVKTWMSEIDKFATQGVCKILVGNKCDMNEERQVTYEEGQQLAKQYEIPFLEASAKKSVNVANSFLTMSQAIRQNQVKFEQDKKRTGGVKFGQGNYLQPNTENETPTSLRKPKQA